MVLQIFDRLSCAQKHGKRLRIFEGNLFEISSFGRETRKKLIERVRGSRVRGIFRIL